jgi:hypothetical protein
MKRREFISLISGVVATWPLAAEAQQRRVPIVGFLRGGTEAGAANLLAAFRKGLSETGFVEGHHIGRCFSPPLLTIQPPSERTLGRLFDYLVGN